MNGMTETRAYMVRELDGRILSWSKGAEELYGWCSDEAVGRKDADLFGGANAIYAEGTQEVLRYGSWHSDLHQRARDGRDLTVESLWMILGRRITNPEKIIVVNKDVTGRGRLEQELTYQEHLSGVGAFAGGVAHDVNNLLAPILMSVDMLRGIVEEDRGKRVLGTIERCARRGMEVVSQVLRLSTRMDGERTTVQVRHLIYEIRNFVNMNSRVPIEVIADYKQDLPVIEAQPTRIFQMLLNLCFNARDAMPDGGTLAIRAEAVDLDEGFFRSRAHGKPGRFVLLSVSDTGKGIPPEILRKIFDPYFTTKAPDGGTGLGLSLVTSIAEAHGGFVEVESRVGSGTTFQVYLPARAGSHDTH